MKVTRSQTRINQVNGVVFYDYFAELNVCHINCHNEVKHSGLESTLNSIRCKYCLIKE